MRLNSRADHVTDALAILAVTAVAITGDANQGVLTALVMLAGAKKTAGAWLEARQME